MKSVYAALAIAIAGAAIAGCREGKSAPAGDGSAEAKPKHGERVGGGVPPPPIVDDDIDEEEYVPAEFKSGADRWKDTGVYLDGKPIGMLSWAELPLSLVPRWVDVKVSAPKRADHPEEKGWTWRKERRYRFSDYCRALGIDLKRIKELHVYGPRFSESVVVGGKELRSKKADGFQFRFGGMVNGKALPVVPDKFGNGRIPDKISAVMIYIDKKPPTLDRNVGFVLDGVEQPGVPYYGEPLRGGVRVYLDDKLVAYIKRQELPQAKATVDADGHPHWSLFGVLADQGVDTSGVVEAWVIRDDMRRERIGRDELVDLMFDATAQASKSSGSTGSILLGPNKYAARAIALHTKPVDPATIPTRTPDEE